MRQKQIKNDYFLMSAAAGLLILSAFWIYFSNKTMSLRDISRREKIIGVASLTIDFGNEKRAFEGEIVEGETILNALHQASQAGNFKYQIDGKNNLAAIENFVKNDKKSWQWYLNDQKISKLPDEFLLKDGDRILIRYEKTQ